MASPSCGYEARASSLPNGATTGGRKPSGSGALVRRFSACNKETAAVSSRWAAANRTASLARSDSASGRVAEPTSSADAAASRAAAAEPFCFRSLLESFRAFWAEAQREDGGGSGGYGFSQIAARSFSMPACAAAQDMPFGRSQGCLERLAPRFPHSGRRRGPKFWQRIRTARGAARRRGCRGGGPVLSWQTAPGLRLPPTKLPFASRATAGGHGPGAGRILVDVPRPARVRQAGGRLVVQGEDLALEPR